MKFNQAFLCKSLLLIAACCVQAQQAQAQSLYVVTTFAGNGSPGFTGDGAAATAAQLNLPVGLAFDAAHTLYIADQLNQRIRQVAASTGFIASPVGNGTAGYSGDKAQGTAAELHSPSAVCVDPSGNFYIADSDNNVIREVTPADVITTVVGVNALGAGYSGDSGAPLAAQLNGPASVILDAAGNLYFSDVNNNRVRKVSFTANTIVTVAGTGAANYTGDGFPAVNAALDGPRGLAFDAAGNLYIADSGNHVIRMVSAATKKISTVAGTGTLGYNGDNIPATSAQLNYPQGIAIDSAGSLYIADSQNFRIRKITNGVITTIAGTGQPGYGGDGLYGSFALLSFPSSVLLDASGKVYVGDSGNNVVRLLTPVASIAPPVINSGGVVSASSFGQFKSVAPASWIEIYGVNLAADSRSWGLSDFQGIHAPTSLDGTNVTIGGQHAFVAFIAGGQLNVQVPTTIGTGPQPVVVNTRGGASLAYTIAVEPLEPGFYAPSSYNLNGMQYLYAQLSDGSVALPAGASIGVASRQAKPGETMVMYGVGFGPVTPSIPAGQIVQQDNTLAEPFHIQFAGVPATVAYSGLAPGVVGLYQFNVVVPNVGDSDTIPITFTVGNYPGMQTLYTAVHH